VTKVGKLLIYDGWAVPPRHAGREPDHAQADDRVGRPCGRELAGAVHDPEYWSLTDSTKSPRSTSGPQFRQVPDEQGRRAQEQQRESDLRDDQAAAERARGSRLCA